LSLTPHDQLRFVTPPVARSVDELRALVADLYGPIESWVVLPGESDLNIRVGLAVGVGMLKISAADGTGFAEFQTRLTTHLADYQPKLPVPKIIPTIAGAPEFITDRGFTSNVHARMTTFLPGTSASDATLTPELLHTAGATLAQLHEALAAFDEVLPKRDTNWDIRTVGEWRAENGQSVETVRTSEQQRWVEILDEFASIHLPQMRQWPAQLIHNDLNGSNVLVDQEERRVTGIFDLGDVNLAPRAVDIAVAAAYLVDTTTPGTLAQGLGALVSGYHAVASLSDDEVELLPHIMKARYALALMLNSSRAEFARDDPDYVAYVTRNSEGSRRRLAAILAQPVLKPTSTRTPRQASSRPTR
jgi:hydroxylysine kinase